MKHVNLHRIARAAAIVLSASLCAPAGAAVQYTTTDIGIVADDSSLPSSGVDLVVGLNKNGEVAGYNIAVYATNAVPNGAFTWTPTTPNATTGSVQFLPSPSPQALFCFPSGLNDAGHVACGLADLFIWDGSSFSERALPASYIAAGWGQINNVDGVAGGGGPDLYAPNALWWQSGAAAPSVIDSADVSTAVGLNNTGRFVGYAYDADTIPRATEWPFLSLKLTLNDDSGLCSDVGTINDSNVTVGWVATETFSSHSDYCVWQYTLDFPPQFKPAAWDSSGTQTDLPTLSGGGGVARWINGSGDIVGASFELVLFPTFHKVQVATLWTGGSIINLNTVTTLPDGWTLVRADRINDSGQIAGLAVDANDAKHAVHAVLLTPKTNNPPTAQCKDVTVNVNAICQASASIDNGSSDPDGDAITLSQSPAGPYALGATLVTLTVTDSNGASSTCTGTVTAQDVTAPTVACPAATSASANASCNAPIPNVLPGVTAADNCTAAASLSKSQSPTAGTLVGLGTTGIVVDVSDASSNTNSCLTSFTVADTSAPTVTSSVAKSVLWSPAHEMENVGFAVSASDNCSAAPGVNVKVYSNEPDQPAGDADASFSPDALNIAAGTLRVRNERLQAGNGRVYLIVSIATDTVGNASASCTTVVVPHDQNNKSLAVVNGLAGAAQSYCSGNNGAIPAGYVQVGTGPVVGPKQ